MIAVQSYPVAVLLCIITMLCWGSWANTQKLASRQWPFQLFYWDYAIGVLLLSLFLAFTLGSTGESGRPFVADLAQGSAKWLGSAFLSGVIFNLSNILLVAAIDIAGMAVAFPVGVGLALILGVITTYWATRSGNAPMSASKEPPTRGIVLSIVAGVLMGGFYSFVAQSMGAIDPATHALEAAKLSPYTALVLFSCGLFISNFLWNTLAMAKPFRGEPVAYRRYFTEGNARLHAVGILGGAIWNLGMAFSIIASTAAGPTLSYGLGQGATMIGAIWGVFVWKEFKTAPAGTNKLLALMFFFYALGLAILIASKA
jgi:glucose uptake protein